MALLSHSETGLDLIDYQEAKEAGTSQEKKARGHYKKYSAGQRYALKHGNIITHV